MNQCGYEGNLSYVAMSILFQAYKTDRLRFVEILAISIESSKQSRPIAIGGSLSSRFCYSVVANIAIKSLVDHEDKRSSLWLAACRTNCIAWCRCAHGDR